MNDRIRLASLFAVRDLPSVNILTAQALFGIAAGIFGAYFLIVGWRTMGEKL